MLLFISILLFLKFSYVIFPISEAEYEHVGFEDLEGNIV